LTPASDLPKLRDATGARPSGFPSARMTHEERHDTPGAPQRAPLVSIVVPAYNAARTIETTLASVLRQTEGDWELLVCDDGSSDDTRARVARLLAAVAPARWRVLELSRSGAAGSRNHGIRAARGTFVAFLDDDDWWEPRKLERCLAALRGGPLDLVCHSEVWRREDGAEEVRHYAGLFDRRVPPLVSLFRNNPFSTSAVVVRRESLLRAGLFDESLPSAEDYDLWIRLAMVPGLRIGFLDEALGTYLLRAGSESSKIDRRMDALLRIGRKYADPLRRAAAGGRLEHWRYVAKTYFTSGVRYAQAGRHARGLGLALAGFLMWPFRFDWVAYAIRTRARRRPSPAT
jgi:glycosyltransferase involved in cell wall biosynthesis